MKRIINYLKQPYPFSDNKWPTIITISLFVSFFLIVFQPFGSSGIESPIRYYIMGGYGLVTFLVLILNLILLPNLFKKVFSNAYWTLGTNIIWLCWILFTIGLGNYFYTLCFFSINGSWWQGLIVLQLFTLMVGVFPITAFTITSYHRMMQKNLLTAHTINQQLHQNPTTNETGQEILFSSENEKYSFTLNGEQLIYIIAEGNYCHLFYETEKGIKKQILRSTLSRMENQLAGNPLFFKCHRAFIVNLKHLEKTVGNSQGLKLIIKGGAEIPVARNNIKTLKQLTTNL